MLLKIAGKTHTLEDESKESDNTTKQIIQTKAKQKPPTEK